jgi:hypothetical protein
MAAYFDFDTPDGEAPPPPDASNRPTICVFDQARTGVVRTRTVTWAMDRPIGDPHHASADDARDPRDFVT